MKFCIAAFVDKCWPETDELPWQLFVMPYAHAKGSTLAGSEITGYGTPTKQAVFCEGPFATAELAERHMEENRMVGGWV